MSARAIYIVTFEAKPDPNGIDGARRLARLLKYAGRSFGLKCVHAVEQRPASAGTTTRPTSIRRAISRRRAADGQSVATTTTTPNTSTT
ncbi:MAG: hypothetical protein NTW19_02740 [Planctomycetota bacterium]|nr:hypothetical protein [Planctomycetota bacterium]